MEIGYFSRDELINVIRGEIEQKSPVILQIDNPRHFVLAIGKCNEKIIVSDPEGKIYLYDPNGNRPLLGIRRFKYVQK